MLELILNIVSELQRTRVLPDGNYAHNFWEQPASYICHISLGDGYFIKKCKNRDGITQNEDADIRAQFEQEYEALKDIYPLFAEHDEFGTPELVYADPEQLILITKELKGQSFEGLCNQYACRVGRKENNAVLACRNAGKFLKILHSHNQAELRPEDVRELVHYIKKRIPPQFFSRVEVQLIHNSLATLQDKVISDIGGYNKCSVHHDLNPTNILVDGERINVLDFADYQMDSPLQDIVYFPLMLGGQLGSRIKYRKRLKDTLLNAFEAGYMGDYGQDMDIGVNALYSLYLLKNLAIFSRTFEDMKRRAIGNFSLGLMKMRLILELDRRKVKEQIIKIVSVW